MQQYRTQNITRWNNAKEYIVLHHTGTAPWTAKWNINACLYWKASFHYLVDEKWLVYKFNNHDAILRHAGISTREWKTNLNAYSIGIETIWPGFSNTQKDAVKTLIMAIMSEEGINKRHVIRHADISPKRKRDIAPEFYAPLTRSQYQDTLLPWPEEMTESQKKMLIISLMNLNSSLHPEIESKEIKDALEKVNQLFRKAWFDNK